jgi:hypothetical protein
MYSIRKNKIVWLQSNSQTYVHYCNLPREAAVYKTRKEADDHAIELANIYPGNLFEVWDMEAMTKLTSIMFREE